MRARTSTPSESSSTRCSPGSCRSAPARRLKCSGRGWRGVLATFPRRGYRPRRGSARSCGSFSIAILPLSDETGEPGLAWTSTGIPEMLGANLSETGKLRILDSLRVLRNLHDLRLTPGRYDEAALSELADLWSVGRLVTGSVRRAGRRLRVDLRLVRVGAGGLTSRYVSAET